MGPWQVWLEHIAKGGPMKTATAIFAGVCLVAVAALAQPKEPSARAPQAAKKPANADKSIAARSPIEGFAMTNISAFEVGELKASCDVDRKNRELTTRTSVTPTQGLEYGGCCFEHTEALSIDPGATVVASLSSSHSEALVHVNVEQSSGTTQLFLARGKLEAGPHMLFASNESLSEVRRMCVAVFGGPRAEPHDTVVRIKRVTFDMQASEKVASRIGR